MRFVKAVLTFLFAFAALAPAQAADVPSSLIVNAGGVEWAWASPCSPVEPSCGGVLVMHDGWNVASAADFAGSFSGFADLLADFTGPGGILCASAYFNSGYSHCDASNVSGVGAAVAVWNAPAAWGANVQGSFSETFVVRGARVPEPGTMALLALGMLGAGLAGRRQRR